MCVLIYFFTGMVPSTACSMSLEGKNYWIIKSLPLDMLSVLKGKMLFNILLFLPTALFAAVTTCISLRASLTEFAVAVFFTVSVNLFSTAYGMHCGAKHMNLDWENEVQVIKQGRAVTAYLLPNMLSTMVIGGGIVALGIIYGILPLLMSGLSAAYLLLAGLSYLSVKKIAARM
jgi:ABC-2 type transport system permease protein